MWVFGSNFGADKTKVTRRTHTHTHTYMHAHIKGCNYAHAPLSRSSVFYSEL